MVLITKKCFYFIYIIIMLSVKRVILTLCDNSVSKTDFKLYGADVKLNNYNNVTTATSRIACCNKCARATGCTSVSFNTDEKICLLSEEVTLQISSNSGWKTYIDTADDCLSAPCLNGATCMDALGTFTCTCAIGWEGIMCEIDINECSGNPCLNSGVCVDHVGYYTCICVTGYIGTNCATDIDECSGNPCLNSGACADHVGYYTCSCVTGYIGTNCATDIDECSENPCLNSGVCVDHVGYYTCNCVTGYMGINCATYIDYCSSNPCINGDCYNSVGTYTCSCYTGWDGDHCETDIDECSGNPCLNGAVCADYLGYYSCACATGYHGTNCGSRYCASGWYYYNYSCYIFVNSFDNWSTSKLNCVNAGAHLVDITSAGEQAFQQQLYEQYHPNDLQYGSVWTGAHGFTLSGDFKWSNNVKLDDYGYQFWGPGQPDDGNGAYLNGENCGYLDPLENFAWNDAWCPSQFLSICEKEITVVLK